MVQQATPGLPLPLGERVGVRGSQIIVKDRYPAPLECARDARKFRPFPLWGEVTRVAIPRDDSTSSKSAVIESARIGGCRKD
jgi:hypothetical protein